MVLMLDLVKIFAMKTSFSSPEKLGFNLYNQLGPAYSTIVISLHLHKSVHNKLNRNFKVQPKFSHYRQDMLRNLVHLITSASLLLLARATLNTLASALFFLQYS